MTEKKDSKDGKKKKKRRMMRRIMEGLIRKK